MPTDVELKDAALVELKQTTVGWLRTNGKPRYTSGQAPLGTHWRSAMDLLAQISSANAVPRDAAVVHLKKTTSGYNTTGTHWKNALAELVKIKNPTTDTWNKIANEYESFSLSGTSEIRYGKDQTWVSKVLPAGTHVCNNATFGDPVPGATKECQIRVGVNPNPDPDPEPTPDPGDVPVSWRNGPLQGQVPLPPAGKKFLFNFPNTIGYYFNDQMEFMKRREAAIGRRYDGMMTAHHPEIFNENRIERIAAEGYIPLIAGGHWGSVVDTAAGAHDAQIRQLAQSLVGKPITMFRLFSEFDMPWLTYTSVGVETQFAAAWRRVVEIFDEVGADNVGFCFCPNEGVDRASADKVWNMLEDRYIDWACVDWYNWCRVVAPDCYSVWTHPGWAEFGELFNYPPGASWSNRHDAWGSRKPFFIPETNTTYDPAYAVKRGEWYRNVILRPDGIKSMQHCIGVSFYDADVSSVEGEAANFQVDYSTQYPQIFDGFKAMAKDPVWHCRGSAGTALTGIQPLAALRAPDVEITIEESKRRMKAMQENAKKGYLLRRKSIKQYNPRVKLDTL